MSDYLGKSKAISVADKSRDNLLAEFETSPEIHAALERIRVIAEAAYDSGERDFDAPLLPENVESELEKIVVSSPVDGRETEIWVDTQKRPAFKWFEREADDWRIRLDGGVTVFVLPDPTNDCRPMVHKRLTRRASQEHAVVRLAPQNALVDPKTGEAPRRLLLEVEIDADKERLFRAFEDLIHRVKDEKGAVRSIPRKPARNARRNHNLWLDMHNGYSAEDAGLRNGRIGKRAVYKAIRNLPLPSPRQKRRAR